MINMGNICQLKINEYKPTEVYIEATKPSKMIIYILGASLFVSGLGMILTMLGM